MSFTQYPEVKIDIDENNDTIMRDDKQFVILDKNYIVKDINETLVDKGKKLKEKLDEISRIHMRIN